MNERIIEIATVNPVHIFGVNDANIDQLRKYFPTIKLIARGNTIKLIGKKEDIDRFENKFERIIDHYNNFGSLTTNAIDRIMESNGTAASNAKEISTAHTDDNIIVYGNNGLVVRARTENQRRIVASTEKNDMVFVLGPAGSGKTYTAVALAVRALKNKEVRRIILTRPAVEAGENLGFLPGDLREKLDPYLQPLYDALNDMIPAEKLQLYFENRTIQIAPLAFMRGRTLDNAFAILDEAQNATQMQMKMFLTRMGGSAKFIITGDETQTDLPKKQTSGLVEATKVLKGIEGIDFIRMDSRDIIRHRLVTSIVNAYDKHEGKEK